MFDSIISCEQCNNIRMFAHGYDSIKKKPMSKLNGTLKIYKDGMKMFAPLCCLFAAYFGNVNTMSYSCKREIYSRVKNAQVKYVLHNNKSFEIYEIKDKQSEIIVDPRPSRKGEQIKLIRNLFFKEHDSSYSIIKKSEYINLKAQQLSHCDSANLKQNITSDYVYLIQPVRSVYEKTNVFKIGRTNQENFSRFNNYEKGFKVLLHIKCKDCVAVEAQIIKHFKSKFRQANEYGAEYFYGDWKVMLKDIVSIAIASLHC